MVANVVNSAFVAQEQATRGVSKVTGKIAVIKSFTGQKTKSRFIEAKDAFVQKLGPARSSWKK